MCFEAREAGLFRRSAAVRAADRFPNLDWPSSWAAPLAHSHGGLRPKKTKKPAPINRDGLSSSVNSLTLGYDLPEPVYPEELPVAGPKG